MPIISYSQVEHITTPAAATYIRMRCKVRERLDIGIAKAALGAPKRLARQAARLKTPIDMSELNLQTLFCPSTSAPKHVHFARRTPPTLPLPLQAPAPAPAPPPIPKRRSPPPLPLPAPAPPPIPKRRSPPPLPSILVGA